MPYLDYNQSNGYLLPPYLEELISADHVARVVNKVVDLLDIRELTSQEKIEGRPAYHPRMMLKILIYAYSQKTPSSRFIARRCAEDVVFMWLSGTQKPDFRTISDFRKNNIKVLKKLFKQVVQICQKLGMVSLGLVAIDGTKVKAATSDYGAKTKEALKEALKAVEADIQKYLAEGLAIDKAEDTLYGASRAGQELPKEVKQALEKREAIVAAIKEIQEIKDSDKTGKKEPKLNPLEKEARFMKHSGGRIRLSYNCQAAVDEKERVIVAADITSEANDKRQLLPMLEKVEETVEKKPKKAVMDAGYHSKENLEKAEKLETDCYVTSRKWEEEVQEKGSSEKEEAKVVVSSIAKSSLQKGVAIVNGDRAIGDGRTRPDRETADAVSRMAAKLQTKEGKEIYRQRKKIVEPVFGQVKSNLEFRRFRLRGSGKAGGEWTLVCLVHNIKKIYAKIMAKGGDLDSLTGELEAVYNPA
ncbi:transposase [Candidatus Hakubella thermalkaliphila]|uniref:Transposase n=2 Tax=Candidatus Hakubella thermalkaliphila TaxID=2754717 RepID=A0A6V8NQ81_9ACTN|nr:IS1182 family transposase [Candidatus Hakubella thermalkaliphila]GFP21431.1 transposase [Candidatus Hakubella thermalkaliphila]